MEQIPNPEEINAATGFLVACTALIGLIIRSIEKRRDKRELIRKIRNGEESIYESHNDTTVN